MNFELTIHPYDLIVIVVYLVGILAAGIWSVRRQEVTGDMFFLAGRSLGWPVVGAALFASNISTIHLVGLAQDGYKRGFVIGNFEWMATFTLILLALVFTPFYFRSRISTLPEFLEKRYGRLARTIMAFMAILAAVLVHIGISLYAGSEVFKEFFGLPVWVSIVIISLVTVIYTVVGGLRAVVFTETIQTVILLGGAILITVLALRELPEKGVHSYAEFNMLVDVQHSEESLAAAADVLTGVDWVMNDSDSLATLGKDFESLAELVGNGQIGDAKAKVLTITNQLNAQQRLGAAKALLSMEGAAEAAGVLGFKPPVEEQEPPTDLLSEEIKKTKAVAFFDAAKAIQTIAEKPEEGAANLMWHIGPDIKEGEKLSFVEGELKKAGYEGTAEIFGESGKWEQASEMEEDAASAAAALLDAKLIVVETGDMNKYLDSDEPIRTPRLSMLRAEGPFFWLAILLGYPILGVWYWCSDQTIVQRVLGAKDVLNAQNGALFAGLLKITPVFLMVLPGTVAFVIMRDEIGGDSASALPKMITTLMPTGLMGLMAAALMAALMSTIAAALNSVGTLVAKDIVCHFRPQTSDAAQVRIGRISAVVLMALAMVWSTQAGQLGTIFEAINKIPALFLAPPITTVFVWGVFWKRGTKEAAVTTLILGLTVGFVLFLIDTGLFGGVQWISDPREGLGSYFGLSSFLIQAVYLFFLWSVVFVIISLATPAPPAEQVENTTWTSPLQVIFRGELIGWYDPRLLTVVLLVMMAILYWVFR